MKINAIIKSKDGGTLVLDFPRDIYDVFTEMLSLILRLQAWFMTSSACFTLMIGLSPVTQIWTPIKRMWQRSKKGGSKRLEKHRSRK